MDSTIVESGSIGGMLNHDKSSKLYQTTKLVSIIVHCLHLSLLLRSVGPLQTGPLLTRFAEKDVKYRLTANSIRGSILWKIKVPKKIAQVLTNHNDSCHIAMHA